MNSEIIGTILIFLVTLLLAYPLGKYIAKVFSGEKTFSNFMNPVERLLFRICGINPNESMNWKQFLKAMLTINMLWLVYAMLALVFQDKLPLNPDGNPGQTPDLAFNTAISFLVSFMLSAELEAINREAKSFTSTSSLSAATTRFIKPIARARSAAINSPPNNNSRAAPSPSFRNKNTLARCSSIVSC
ncbi:MAG TPA: potassium-transporting ATPase subunit KdpA, partial [Chitinophagaceae bacterium]|nr:potassium-transporting ATPase subunit KdpA [Chitinophagaceae bacterium]